MKKGQYIQCLTFLACISISCAGADVQSIRISSDTNSQGIDDSAAEGFRYYEASPYVLVYSDGKSGLVSRVVWLPDPTKKRTIKPYDYLASNTTKLKFSNGVLTEATLEGDGTAFPKAVIDAVKTAATAAAKGAFREAPPAPFEVPSPQLYKIVVESSGISLVGGPPLNKDNQPISVKVILPNEGGAQ